VTVLWTCIIDDDSSLTLSLGPAASCGSGTAFISAEALVEELVPYLDCGECFAVLLQGVYTQGMLRVAAKACCDMGRAPVCVLMRLTPDIEDSCCGLL
jgi:hypothetical protein